VERVIRLMTAQNHLAERRGATRCPSPLPLLSQRRTPLTQEAIAERSAVHSGLCCSTTLP